MRLWLRLVALCFVAAAPACGRREVSRVAAESDAFGYPEPALTSASRIVSLNPTTTELLIALGAGDRLVGRSRYDVFPSRALAIPDLGPAIQPSVERILAAHPDLVVLYAAGDNRAAAQTLSDAGVAVLSLRIDQIVDFMRSARTLGHLVGADPAAAQLVDTVQRTLDRVRRATSALPRPRLFIHAWERPLLTIGAGSYLSELVDIAGGRNIFDDVPAPSAEISFEEVVRRDPDALLVGPETAARLRASPQWQAVRAVREGRFVAYDTTLAGRPSARLGEAALAIARQLHPGLVVP